jgi:Zn-finger protein
MTAHNRLEEEVSPCWRNQHGATSVPGSVRRCKDCNCVTRDDLKVEVRREVLRQTEETVREVPHVGGGTILQVNGRYAGGTRKA